MFRKRAPSSIRLEQQTHNLKIIGSIPVGPTIVTDRHPLYLDVYNVKKTMETGKEIWVQNGRMFNKMQGPITSYDTPPKGVYKV